MNHFLEVFRNQMNSYFEKRITKIELGEWANKEYYHILTGDYLIIDKLVCYSYLKKVANFHTEIDDMADIYPSSEQEIYDIKQIINGVESDNFFGIVVIMDKFFEQYSSRKIKDFLMIKEIVLKVKNNLELSESEKNKVKKFVNSKIAKEETLIDLVEFNIISLLRRSKIIDFFDIEPNNDFKLYVDNRKTKNPFFYSELIGMLDIILGKSALQIGVRFQNGKSELFTVSYNWD